MAAVDHLVWAAPDLDRAVAELETLTGERAHPGGAHPGNGTRNAVLGLGGGVYLEVLAPDPAQSAAVATATNLARLPGPTLHTFAVASPRLDRIAAKLEKAGLPHAGIIPMSRRLPSGQLVRWRLLTPAGHAYGPLMPFFIDWGDSPHPSEALAGDACQLSALRLSHPEAWSLGPLLERLEVEVEVATGPAGLVAELETPKGAVRLSSRDRVPG
jgi:hypothetical protein